MAVASNNLSLLTSLMAEAEKPSITEMIEKSIGVLKVTYYQYVDAYRVKPFDLLDMVEGILFQEIKSEQLRQMREKNEQSH